MSQFVECPQKHIDNENCDKISKQDVNISLPHTREEIIKTSGFNNIDFATNSQQFSLKIEAVDTNERSKLNLKCSENDGKGCDEAIDVEKVVVAILKPEINSIEVGLEDEVSKLNLECSDVEKDRDEVKDFKQDSKAFEFENEVTKLNSEHFEHVEKNCNEAVDVGKVEVVGLKPETKELDLNKVEFEGKVSKLDFVCSEHVEKDCNEAVHSEKLPSQISPSESNLRISNNVPIELVKVENTLSCSTELIFDSKENDIASVEAIRRNSLPEGGRTDLNKIIVNSTSENFDNVSHVDKIQTLQSDRTKVAPNMHNISDVVRNVHGLFSIVKNAYKPMEKNIGEMMIATQKNLSSAKNGYLNMKQESKSHDIVENLSKYSTLNLSNENKDLDNAIFSKCDNLKSAEKSSKNSVAPHNLNEKFNGLANSDVGSNLDVNNSKKNFESGKELNRQSQFVDGIVKMDSFSIDEESIGRLVDGVGAVDTAEDKRSSEGMEVLEATVLEQNAELDALRQALSQKDAVKRELEAKISNVS